VSTAVDRLGRVLNLVPYLLARPGIRIEDAAADLGVGPAELRDDLQLLWVCGLPGYGPGDLIDMSLDGDTVTITYDAGIDRPLRLTPDEGLALTVALRTLAETPGLAHRDAVERALAKIESAAGEAADTAGRVAVSRRCAARWTAGTRCGSGTTRPVGTCPPSGWSTRCGC
jgi:proteasome accessory factor C